MQNPDKTGSKLPGAYDFVEGERRYANAWAADGTYHYDPTQPRENTFSIDTPPPTVSGYLHIGHMFSYSQTDFVARYQRMLGRNVFYPMGWDDNGLPTERRVQNYFNVRCDPTLPYEAGLTDTVEPPEGKSHARTARHVSRENFIELCHRVTVQDENVFKELWTRLGLSVDWRQEYATIDHHSRHIAQLSFFDLMDKGHIYQTTAPMMWDTTFGTAVAQAEVEDRPIPGAMHRVVFGVEGSDDIVHIATTRPELLPACVGLAAHPEDSRYAHLFGRRGVTPLFGMPVPIFASDRVDREKGTGMVMVCTFGDATDVQWWQERKLETRQMIGRDGRLLPLAFAESVRSDALANYEELVGLSTKKARARVVEMLREPGSGPAGHESVGLVGEPESLEHAVKFYEKGDVPLEFISTRQWFVRLLDKKDALLTQGERLHWTPEFMGTRYRSWTENLQFDWCISRQRYFGVAIPVWYSVDAQGRPDYGTVLRPDPASLPVDPMSQAPPGYAPEQRGQPNGFIGDPDVLDTWFTSSVSPQVNTGWLLDPERHQRLFPFDVRPQAHDIIRTWTFYTVAKALLHENRLPWHHVLVSGWVLDPNRKKMSKSVGNVTTPSEWLDRYGADALRYWAANARLGVDTTFDESILRVGRRLVIKIFNAAKFVYQQEAAPGVPSEELDLGFLLALSRLVERVTAAYDRFDYSFALSETESFFWSAFTDSYIELVKERSWRSGQEAASAAAALHVGLGVMLRLFAPVLPYITEEVWSWRLRDATGVGSIHRAPWPSRQDFAGIPTPQHDVSFDTAVTAIAAVRKFKAAEKVSMMAPLAALEFRVNPDADAILASVLDDVVATARAPTATIVADSAVARDQVGVNAKLEEE